MKAHANALALVAAMIWHVIGAGSTVAVQPIIKQGVVLVTPQFAREAGRQGTLQVIRKAGQQAVWLPRKELARQLHQQLARQQPPEAAFNPALIKEYGSNSLAYLPELTQLPRGPRPEWLQKRRYGLGYLPRERRVPLIQTNIAEVWQKTIAQDWLNAKQILLENMQGGKIRDLERIYAEVGRNGPYQRKPTPGDFTPNDAAAVRLRTTLPFSKTFQGSIRLTFSC